MRTNPLTLLCLGAAVAGAATIGAATADGASERPNIIVVLADDLGYSDLGCYGGEIPTPHIDALASNGARLTQLYNSARCCPSRASLMTGLYPSQAGIGDFTTNRPSKDRGPGYLGRLNDQCVTLAEALGDAGYGCYYVGKWHMHAETGPIKRGFDEFYGYTRGHSHDQYDSDYYIRLPRGRAKEIDPPKDEYYATDVFNDYAIEFIRQGQASGEPWFLFLGHSSPHFPVQAPAERADKHFETYLRGWDALREERFARMKELGLVDGERWRLSPRAMVPVDRDEVANGYPGQENPAWDSLDEPRRRDLARRMAVFAAMVEGVDAGVGQITEHLRKTGDLENTFILFLSDNGACYEWGPFGFDGQSRRGTTTLREGDALRDTGGPGTHQSYGSGWANLGNTPLRLYKHFTHEGGISTPCIAHWPAGIGKPDTWVRDPAHVMDVMPTLLSVAGAEYPAERGGVARPKPEGVDLLPAMRGEALAERTIGFDHQGAHAIRRGDWKAVWSKRMPEKIEWELYNLGEDRCEMRDLALSEPDVLAELTDAWEVWARRVGVIYEPATANLPPQPAQPNASPLIAKRAITVSGEVAKARGSGVIAAQGGREQGYAVHLVGGKLAWDVRVDGEVTRIISPKSAPRRFSFIAKLDRDEMLLSINGQEVARAASPGLLSVEPKDDLNVGYDDNTAAGDYGAPNTFAGVVQRLDVQTGEKPTPARVVTASSKIMKAGDVPKPMFADPNYHGSCDPEVVWNPADRQWWVFYTARRATRDKATYVGTPIGAISSRDLASWTFRGYLSFDGVPGAPDMPDTHWAPGVHFDGERFHMFATYKNNALPPWGGKGVIRHYVTTPDRMLDGWRLVGTPGFVQPDPIDVSLVSTGNDFRAYYRVGKGGGIQWATSTDLTTWKNQGKCRGDVNAPVSQRGFGYQEAPYVFHWGDRYWMLTDPHKGLAVYESPDGVTWSQRESILKERGDLPADGTLGRHPSVAVVDDRAFLFYHTEPNRPYPTPPAEKRTPEQKVSFLQMAELKIENGQLVCDRNAAIDLPTPDRTALAR